ncbi:MAG: DUF3426 domain-containing protein, partial [Proteobacteria bacterium]|nr:DUF3426 domain-containing protein [Pseudomonadota bacterium]
PVAESAPAAKKRAAPVVGDRPPPPGFDSWEEFYEHQAQQAAEEEAARKAREDAARAPSPAEEEGELDEDFEVPSIEDVTVQADRPKRRAAKRYTAPKRSIGAIIGWAALALVVVGVLGGGYFFRNQVIAMWPPASKLYEVAGLVRPATYALALGNISPAQERDGETLVLVITGDISNITEDTQAVPRLRGAILDAQSRELFTWTFAPPSPELGAGETVAFATRVPNPPEGARGVAVTFSTEGATP